MSKLSSYQKLKARIIELELDIYQMAMHDDSYQGMAVKAKWRLYFNGKEAMKMGSRDNKLPMKSGGIIPFIAKRQDVIINHQPIS